MFRTAVPTPATGEVTRSYPWAAVDTVEVRLVFFASDFPVAVATAARFSAAAPCGTLSPTAMAAAGLASGWAQVDRKETRRTLCIGKEQRSLRKFRPCVYHGLSFIHVCACDVVLGRAPPFRVAALLGTKRYQSVMTVVVLPFAARIRRTTRPVGNDPTPGAPIAID